MSSNGEAYYSLADVLDTIKAYLAYLLRKWYILLLALILGGALGFALYTMQKPKYTAECTFILEEKQSGMGGLSGLASQFGLDIGSVMGGSGMFAGDNILEIIRSRSILEQVLVSKVDSNRSTQTLADIYLDFGGLRNRWKENPKLAHIRFDSVRRFNEMNVLQDSVLNIIYNSVLEKNLLVERVSKKGSIMRVRTTSYNPDFSRTLVSKLVHASKDYYISVKTSIISANINRLQKKADSLLALLTGKTYQAAQAQINDANPGLRMLQVPTEIASRDKTILATLYSEVVKNLEMARTTLMMQTPVLEVLDVPSISLYDNLRSKLFFIVVGAFVLAVLTSFILFFTFSLKKAKDRKPAE